jgi:hypothetical protein
MLDWLVIWLCAGTSSKTASEENSSMAAAMSLFRRASARRATTRRIIGEAVSPTVDSRKSVGHWPGGFLLLLPTGHAWRPSRRPTVRSCLAVEVDRASVADLAWAEHAGCVGEEQDGACRVAQDPGGVGLAVFRPGGIPLGERVVQRLPGVPVPAEDRVDVGGELAREVSGYVATPDNPVVRL